MRYPLAGGANEPLVAYQSRALAALTADRLRELEGRGFVRCAAWRALTDDDIQRSSGGPTDGRSYFNALNEEARAYYWEVG